MSAEDPAALIRSAKSQRDGGRLPEAIALQRRAVALLAEGDRDAHAHALRHLADILSDFGDPPAAAPLYAEALAHYAGAETLDTANAMRGAAVNAARLGRTAEARALWEQLRDRYAALGVEAGVAEAERRLAR